MFTTPGSLLPLTALQTKRGRVDFIVELSAEPRHPGTTREEVRRRLG